MSPARSSSANRPSEAPGRWLERIAWPAAGVLLAVIVYLAMPATGPESIKALHAAVLAGDLDRVRVELARGIEPDQPNVAGWSATHYAAYRGDAAVLAALLDAGADVNRPSAIDGQTPLHRAAVGGSAAVVEMLLDRGAAIGTRSRRGESALGLALQNKNPGVAATLLERGAEVTGHEGRHGFTALHQAVLIGRLRLVEQILARGGSVADRTRRGETPLHMASAGRPAILDVLIEHGADPGARDRGGKTPLHAAALTNCVGCIDRLLEAGAPVNARNAAGLTPADMAARQGHDALAERLRQLQTSRGASAPAPEPAS